MQGVSHLHLTLLAQNIHWQAHLVGGRVGAGPAADRVTVDANCGPVRSVPENLIRPTWLRGHAHVKGVNN